MKVTNRLIGRTVLTTLLLIYLGFAAYGQIVYGDYEEKGDQVVCGIVGESKTYEDLVSTGKHSSKVVEGVIASVDFGQYGTRAIKIPDETAFLGQGAQHCVYRSSIDPSTKVPNGWQFFMVLNWALFFTLVVMAFCVFLWFIVELAFGDEE